MPEPKPDLKALRDDAHAIIAGQGDRDERLLALCRLLAEGIGFCDWVGFYIADTDDPVLHLGPFVGAPTEHIDIPFGRGICGQAAERLETFVVQDVASETNYLSCSASVRSEIVVPILLEGRIVAELDIDSHTPSPFTDENRAFFEDVARMAAKLF